MNTKLFWIIAIVVFVIWYKNRPATRGEKIDYLNINAGNFTGVWVKMSDDELDTSYKVLRLVKSGLKPNDTDAVRFQEIIKKYNINL